MNRKDYLSIPIEHFDIKKVDATPLVNQFRHMAFQARNVGLASDIYQRMLEDNDCTVILCLAGSLFSAGLKQVVVDLVDSNMVDAIVATGAIMVDQDFFEALGFRHYRGTSLVDDNELMEQRIDRIYDTYIDEDDLRICDMTIRDIADGLDPGAYSSREFILHMGKYLEEKKKGENSVVLSCFRKGVPVFCPAFSDSSAGFGLVLHQQESRDSRKVTIDSVKDFLELTRIKIASGDTGLLMVGGGVPKNFAQDTPVAAEILGNDVNMHKYVIQITVADERDGGLSGSTLKEAHSWGKVDTGNEIMVFGEATVIFPLISSYAYHSGCWRSRKVQNYNKQLRSLK